MSPTSFRVLWPDVGLEGTMKHMAGRKRHSAEDIVRKLRRADELAAEGKTGEEIAAELHISEKAVEKHITRALSILRLRIRHLFSAFPIL